MAYQCLFFLILSLSYIISAFAKGSCNSNDLIALQKLRAQIQFNTMKPIWEGKNCCQWHGIACDKTSGRVIGIDLPSLTSTTEMIQTQMTGPLTPSITLLSSLQVLDLGGQLYLSGNIPKDIGFRLPNLRKLSLYANKMTGPVPESIGNLVHLQELQLAENSFDGSIPSSIGNLKNLQRFILHNNKFSGSIPDSISRLTKLVTLDLGSNALNGSIPEKIGELQSVTELDLSSNRLTGNIPASVSNLTAITTVYLNSNFLQGEIPFPVKYGDMPSLGFLRLQDNQLTGRIPPTFGFLSSLKRVSFSNNRLEGPIPASFGKLLQLQELYADGNMLNGSLPESLGKLSNLNTFTASRNMIQDPLPQEMSFLSNLQYIDLSFNHLHLETFPKVLAQLPSLSKIHLAGCGIKGMFPEALNTTQSSLLELDLSSNNLTGSIPAWIGRHAELYSLNLSRNSLVSTIPGTISSMTRLGILDLHSNNLTGSVQVVFDLGSNFPGGSLEEVDLSDNSFSTGHENIGTGSQIGIQLLNLSHNAFRKGLPTSLGKLGSLSTLDFSNNQLQATLPDSMPYSLKILKVQKNHLTGAIPPSYSSLTQLRELDLSDNLLAGEIPNGKPFCSFPVSSYSGNTGLCGKPLPPCKKL